MNKITEEDIEFLEGHKNFQHPECYGGIRKMCILYLKLARAVKELQDKQLEKINQ